jgi:hypothetical protein
VKTKRCCYDYKTTTNIFFGHRFAVKNLAMQFQIECDTVVSLTVTVIHRQGIKGGCCYTCVSHQSERAMNGF